MSDPLLVIVFLLAAAVSLGTSWLLVSALERIGARLGLSEALLGVLAAVAADAPELTAAVTALAGHHAQIGSGVVIGSNVFNLAALLGLSAFVARRVALHRRVVAFEGVIAIVVASVCAAVVVGGLATVAGLIIAAAVVLAYVVLIGMRRDRLRRLRLPVAWTRWLSSAIHEEELELEEAIRPVRARPRDMAIAVASVVVVVGASIAMEQAVAELGRRHAIPEVVVGGLILAAVTSMPNAVAGIHLARRGRGAASLSTALNSNAINVTAGLLLPGVFAGLAPPSGSTTLIALYYLGLTVFVLAAAYGGRGLRRPQGAVIICAYLVFVGALLATA